MDPLRNGEKPAESNRHFSSDPAVRSSIFVGAEREENLIDSFWTFDTFDYQITVRSKQKDG